MQSLKNKLKLDDSYRGSDIILALDPGTKRTGWCFLVDGEPKHWCTEKGGNVENKEIYPIIKAFDCPVIIENVSSYGASVGQTTFDTVNWIGRFTRETENLGLPWDYVTRQEVKLVLLQTPRATDVQVRQKLIDLFGGLDKAIGGKKCRFCKGKKWTGRSHDPCEDCNVTGYETAPGPLKGITGHTWSALAVGFVGWLSSAFVLSAAQKERLERVRKINAV